jgi:ribosomal protein L37AE/L43A
LQGRTRIPHRCITSLFRVETGPVVLCRICEDTVVGGNSIQHRHFGLFSGAWAEAGPQATELLAAVRIGSFGIHGSSELSRKKQRLRSNLESAQPARCRLCPSVWSSGIGAPIFHCRLCGLDSRELPTTPWCLGADVHPLRMGVGLLEAATVFRETTAGVACLPKLCAALRLKTFEAWPDARCGPLRGKAVIEDSSSLLGAVFSGPWEPGAGGFVPSGYDLAARQRKR